LGPGPPAALIVAVCSIASSLIQPFFGAMAKDRSLRLVRAPDAPGSAAGMVLGVSVAVEGTPYVASGLDIYPRGY
jgi:hypothetical protein